jgi:threonine aldolase
MARGLAAIPGVRLAWPVQVNEVFAIAPRRVVEPLRSAGAQFYEWTSRAVAAERAPREGEAFLRFVCSFDTRDAEVDQLVAIISANSE